MQKILNNLGIKQKSQEVFIFLLKHGLSPVSDIAFGLSMPKSSVYDSISDLQEKGLVTEYSTDKTKEYEVIDPDQLSRLNDETIEKLKKDQDNLIEVIKNTKKVGSSVKPKIKFYMGEEGVKQAFRDTTWNKKCKTSYLMWPQKEMFKTLGLEFTIWHSGLRLKSDTHLKIIQKDSDRDFIETVEGAKELLKAEGWGYLCETRTAPKDADWKMTFWIYDKKVMFASGGNEKIAFVVDSEEFSDMMLMLWKQMWKVSEKE